jgi:hypothetical protein
MAKDKKAKPIKTGKRAKSIQPMSVQLGWLEAESAKDARAYARGIIQQRFKAHEESWYAILPFHGGFLWEAHQGGDGKGHIKAAAKALEDDPGGEHWFKTGDRAYRVVMQDGKPFPHLLPPEKSVEILNSGTECLPRNDAMTPYIRKGTGWLVTGILMSGSAALFFVGSIAFYAFAYNPGPSVRAADIGSLPHTKWPMVANVGIEEIVQKLQMKNGNDWSVDRRSHKVDGLDKLRQQRADLERANRERDALANAEANAATAAAAVADEEELKKTIEDAKLKNADEAEGVTTSGPDVIPVATPSQTVPAASGQTSTGEQR